MLRIPCSKCSPLCMRTGLHLRDYTARTTVAYTPLRGGVKTSIPARAHSRHRQTTSSVPCPRRLRTRQAGEHPPQETGPSRYQNNKTQPQRHPPVPPAETLHQRLGHPSAGSSSRIQMPCVPSTHSPPRRALPTVQQSRRLSTCRLRSPPR